MANPVLYFCTPHSLSNAGKYILENKNQAISIDLFGKQWQKVVQYAGKARELSEHYFDESVKLTKGIRFFIRFEQIFIFQNLDWIKQWNELDLFALKRGGRMIVLRN